MSTEKKYTDENGVELTGDDLRAARKRAILAALEADQILDTVIAEMTERVNEAKMNRSKFLADVDSLGVDRFKHPAGYPLKITTRKDQPGSFYLKGKPKVAKENEDVFDLDEA